MASMTSASKNTELTSFGNCSLNSSSACPWQQKSKTKSFAYMEVFPPKSIPLTKLET